MSERDVTIVETHRLDPRVVALHEAKDEELKERYHEYLKRKAEKGERLEQPLDDATVIVTLLALVDGQPAGTIILRNLGLKYEIKRLSVNAHFRGLGLAKRLIAECEERVLALGGTEMWLHTGILQPDAIGLYEKTGWTRLPRVFEPYIEDGYSICFRKNLRVDSGPGVSTATERLQEAQHHYDTARAALERAEKALDELRCVDDAMRPLVDYYDTQWSEDRETAYSVSSPADRGGSVSGRPVAVAHVAARAAAARPVPVVAGEDAIWDLISRQHDMHRELLSLSSRFFTHSESQSV